MDPSQQELDSRFTYHPPTHKKQAVYVEIRAKAKALAEYLMQNVPDGREKALALTKLEESVMWANAGVARGND